MLSANHPREIQGLTSTSSARPCSSGTAPAASSRPLNKNGFLYVWRATGGRGAALQLRLSNPTLAAPLLSQPAYSARTGALYVATPGRLVRVDVNRSAVDG